MNGTLASGAANPCYEPDGWYLRTEGLFSAFYIVKPSRTMCPSIHEVPNFYYQVVMVGPILFIIESILMRLQGYPLYKWNDSLTGLCALTIAGVPQAFLESVVFGFYTWFYERYRLVDIPYDSMWTYVMCIFAFELSLYVGHRTLHEVNILWGSHQFHHSGEYYNIWAGGRTSFMDKFLLGVFGLPWAFIIPPGPALAHHQLNLCYQLWIHTSVIGNLGPLEYILNTPTQHAIHHGRNRFCIDVNYGGVLSIYDQLFGTMVWPKRDQGKIYYGLVHPLRTWDIAYTYLHSIRDVYRRIRKYDNFSDKLGAIWKGPGWEPGKPRLGLLEDIPEVPVDKEPYDKQSPVSVYAYCTLHLLLAFSLSAGLVSLNKVLPWQLQLTGFAYVVWTTFNVGYALEHKWYFPGLEWTRCALFFVVEWLMPEVFGSLGFLARVMEFTCATSVVIWSFNLKYFSSKIKDD